MKNFVIDVGNSNCKIAYEKGGILEEIRKSAQFNIADFIINNLKDEEADVIVLSNVREENKILERKLAEFCRKLVVLGPETELPLNLRYKFDATEMGGDRIAGILGMAMMFPGENLLKFDFGTALTVDFLDKSDLVLGGNISLGFRSRFRGLNNFTKRLPLIMPDKTYPEIGVSTNSALTAGVVLGIIFEIEGYINRYPDYKVVFTGGDSIYFAKKMKSPIFVVPNLVMIGLAQIAEYYANKK